MLKPHKRRGGSAVIERMFSTAMLGFVASNLTAAIGPVVDGIIVGTNYGVDEVAAIGLTSFLLVGYRTVTASIISKGAHVIASGRLGAGDREGADRIFALSVLLSLLVAVTLALVSIIFPQQIAVLIGARKGLEHLVKPTADYLKGKAVPQEIVVKYDAIVTTEAPVHVNTEKNEVSTEYSHKPQ